MFRLRFVRPSELVSRLAACVLERRVCRRCQIVIGSLFYNQQFNFKQAEKRRNYLIDTCLAPFFWLIENYVRRFGPLFVTFLLSMMGLVVSIVFAVIIPYEIKFKSWPEIVFYLVTGHYLLLNTLFNYGMAFRTSPGHVPNNMTITSAVGMCKNCIAPKPARAHHCSVCNMCVLKMDHHCPWLNKCVGHYNHRYFMLTMFYMWTGCLLIVCGSWSCFYEHYWENPFSWCEEMYSDLAYSHYLCDDPYSWANETVTNWSNSKAKAHNSIILVFLVCIGMIVGVGGLITWHIRLVTRGETSIELHINNHTRAKWASKGKVYRNPYDFGWAENWRILLGIEKGRGTTLLRNILWPSRHLPAGDGIVWRTSSYTLQNVENNDEDTEFQVKIHKV